MISQNANKLVSPNIHGYKKKCPEINTLIRICKNIRWMLKYKCIIREQNF